MLHEALSTMNLMITLSLFLNIAVLVPVCAGLVMNARWAVECYGAATQARGVLLSVYLALLKASVLLLLACDPKLVVALLSVQVAYKLTTPFTVGTLVNPVVVSNLGIAAFHVITLTLIWQWALASPMN